MKHILLILTAVLYLGGTLSAQTQMNSTVTLAPTASYYKYVGNASDTIKRVADSVYIELINQFDHEWKINVGSKFDKVSGNDTSVVVNIWGKNFADESYTLLNQATTANVTANNYIYSSAYTAAARYRYIKVSYRIKGTPKSAGVKVDQIEVKLWKP